VGLRVAAGGPLDPGDRRYYIQDEASQLVALLLGPAPGETVLDACAAPGGKATHIAQLMEDRGSLLAVDRSPARLKAVVRAAGRLGATIVRTLAADAARPLAPGDIPPGGFDAVLVDAPCTGLGVLRRTPDIKLRRREGDIKRSSELQGELLENLSATVRRGGRLVYSVCTFEPEETDEVVDAFLSTHRDFSLEDARGRLPPACGPLVDERGFMRTMPHRGGMDGFFAARLRRA